MTKTSKLVGVLSAGLLGLGAAAVPAVADEHGGDRQWSFSFNVAGTTDYVFRGFSQTDEKPAFQAGVDVGYGIFYLGAWGSGTDQDFVGGSPAEIDFYGGVTPSLGMFDFDFGFIYYWYPGENDIDSGFVDVSYWEGKAGVSTDDLIKNLTIGFTAYYSPEYTFETGETWALEGSLSYALPSLGPFSPTISGLAGYFISQDGANGGLTFDAAGLDDDYWYWNVGLELAIEKFTLDFRYWGTDISQSPANQAASLGAAGLADDRFVFTGKFTY